MVGLPALTEGVHGLGAHIPGQTIVPLALAIAVRGKAVHCTRAKVTLEAAVQAGVQLVIVVVGFPGQAVRDDVVLRADVFRFQNDPPGLQEVEQGPNFLHEGQGRGAQGPEVVHHHLIVHLEMDARPTDLTEGGWAPPRGGEERQDRSPDSLQLADVYVLRGPVEETALQEKPPIRRRKERRPPTRG